MSRNLPGGIPAEVVTYREKITGMENKAKEVYRVIQNLCPPSPVKSTWPRVELTVIPNNATNLKNICQKSWCGSLSLAQDRIF